MTIHRMTTARDSIDCGNDDTDKEDREVCGDDDADSEGEDDHFSTVGYPNFVHNLHAVRYLSRTQHR